ncbi:YwqJ-related putative deaminase [Actinophytocola algeriensis]|uniref:YwqJ-like deaminase n=1 Tax=Actinophytocola algeriensis TaxID=1768010 RepID=A0A7W7VJ88_9PSEU|nr:YwqJ-related putative deaminase [Actinophytocola algeriensis]MBB4912253.1 hypothetical protein [Actinophytocola algeriensis]MBE1474231.1 hypothetical protein [Actinophytocola algeriensis]
MEPFGDDNNQSDGGKEGGKRALEDRFKERVAKRVRFTLPEGHVDKTTPTPRAPHAFDPDARQTLTGARNTRLDQVPHTGKHPLTAGERNELEDNSYRLATRTDDTFRGARDQPTMAGTLLAGDSMSAHTSMKGGARPRVHPVVQALLDELEGRVDAGEDIDMGRGHGRCAEIGTISDYLWNVDPNTAMTITEARAHFEYVGGATAAHQTHADNRGRFHLRPACDTCAYVTQKLAIASLRSEY